MVRQACFKEQDKVVLRRPTQYKLCTDTPIDVFSSEMYFWDVFFVGVLFVEV